LAVPESTIPLIRPEELDELIHNRTRLGIFAFLSTAGASEFLDLARVLNTTNGNLSSHLRKLEEAGYVAVRKSFLNRKSLTVVELTTSGRHAFEAYVIHMKAAVEQLSALAFTDVERKADGAEPPPR
jgi:DNA-binding MarR family transcriptional regulator